MDDIAKKTWTDYVTLGKEVADVLNGGESYAVYPLHMSYALLNADIRAGRTGEWVKCIDCGLPFETGNGRTNFCSDKCETATLSYMNQERSINIGSVWNDDIAGVAGLYDQGYNDYKY